MNILYAGTPHASAKILDNLAGVPNISIKGVITKPDKPNKRGKKLHESKVSEVARKLNLPIFKPESLNQDDFVKNLTSIDIDILVVVAYGKIIPNWLINSCKILSLNVHFSILPKYRGASPIQSVILNGENKTGITIIKLNENLDEGDIIEKLDCNIASNENKIELEKNLINQASKLLPKTLEKIYQGKHTLAPQNNKDATYCKKINKDDSLVDSNHTSKLIYNKFRAFIEWPGVFFIHKNTKIKIHKLEIFEGDNIKWGDKKIILDKEYMLLKTADKPIVITHLQFPNKKIISSKDAFNSYSKFFA